jgi:hypothetical protein
MISELRVLTGLSHPPLFVPDKPYQSMPTVVGDRRDGLLYLGRVQHVCLIPLAVPNRSLHTRR